MFTCLHLDFVKSRNKCHLDVKIYKNDEYYICKDDKI